MTMAMTMMKEEMDEMHRTKGTIMRRSRKTGDERMKGTGKVNGRMDGRIFPYLSFISFLRLLTVAECG